jgi:hypothetical protein
LQTWAGILTLPDGNVVVALIPCYVGSLDEGERLVEPLRRFGSPVADMIAPLPYVAMQQMFDPAFPPGRLTGKPRRRPKMTTFEIPTLNTGRLRLRAFRRATTSLAAASVFGLPSGRAQSSWLAEYLHEITVFPNGNHDDQIDSTAHRERPIVKVPALLVRIREPAVSAGLP